MLASLVFWFTVIFYDDVYDFTLRADFDVLICLHTIPSGLMLIEYPFNMIPFDWRMLPFDVLMMLLYGVDTILF